MKRRLLTVVILVIALCAFSFSGCSAQHKLEFFVNGELVKDLRCDTLGTVSPKTPSVLGYRFERWETENGEVFTSETPVKSDLKLNAVFTDLISGKQVTSAKPLQESAITEEYKVLEGIGKVNAVYLSLDGAYIVAEGYYGYHMEDDPKMIMGIGFDKTGKITSITTVKQVEQTPAYAAEIDQEYLNCSYIGVNADADTSVEAVTGATLTSKAVMFAVNAAGNYAKKALGYKLN